MPRIYFKFEEGQCELIHATMTPEIFSILIAQKCCICFKNTGFGYYTKTGKAREDRMNQKCTNCMEMVS